MRADTSFLLAVTMMSSMMLQGQEKTSASAFSQPRRSPELRSELPDYANFVELREADYAKMSVDDPRLKSVYARIFDSGFDTNPYGWPMEVHISEAFKDLIRRGDSTTPMLIQLMRDNPDSTFELNVLHKIRSVPGINADPYLDYCWEILSSRYNQMDHSLARIAIAILLSGSDGDITKVNKLKGQRRELDQTINELLAHKSTFKIKTKENAEKLNRLSQNKDIIHLREQDFNAMSFHDERLHAAYVQLFLKADENHPNEWPLEEHLKAAMHDLVSRKDKSFDILWGLFLLDHNSNFANSLLKNIDKIPGVNSTLYLEAASVPLRDHENINPLQAAIVADFITRNGDVNHLYRLRITAKIRPDLADIILPKIEFARGLLLENAGIKKDSAEAKTHIFGYEIDNAPPGSGCCVIIKNDKEPLLKELSKKYYKH